MATNNAYISAGQDTLQQIRARKAEVRSQMKESADAVKATLHGLFAPPPKSSSKLGSFMSMVDQGLAVYDGVMMGMKVARNIRRIFGRRRR